MRRLTRILGRRDMKVFLLLWAPVVWVWVFAASVPRGDQQYFVNALTFFLAQILGPGLILLGTAAGVDRHNALSRLQTPYRIRGDVRSLALTFVAGVLLIVAAIVAAWRGCPAWGLTNWLSRLYPPGGSLFAPYAMYQPAWEASRWIAACWLGWIVGYRLGRRWGHFLKSLIGAAAATGFAALVLHTVTRLPSGGESATEGWISGWYSGAFFADAAAVLAVYVAADLLAGLWLSRRGTQKALGGFRAAASVSLLGLFLVYRDYLIQHTNPWPPPANEIVGLDPSSGRLWFLSGPRIWNFNLYAIDYPDPAHAEGEPRPQIVYTMEDVHPFDEYPIYIPSAPAMLVWRDRETATPCLECRRPGGIERIDFDPGGWFFSPLLIRCPRPVWLGFADLEYEIESIQRIDGSITREFRIPLFLYCPETGERRTAFAYPKVQKGGLRAPWQGSGYEIWPETEYFTQTKPERVLVRSFGPPQTANLRALCSDDFLASYPHDGVTRTVFSYLNHIDGKLLWECLCFELFTPQSDGDLQKIPSPTGKRGCLWKRMTGTLEIWENGRMVAPPILDATGEVAPSWSADGEYLVYAATPQKGMQCVIKLAYPEEKELMRTETLQGPSMGWAPQGKAMAVVNEARPDKSQLTVFQSPEADPTTLNGVSSAAFLHDGSLAYASDGMVFQWRPEWQEPVCVYDPGKRTIRRSLPGN